MFMNHVPCSEMVERWYVTMPIAEGATLGELLREQVEKYKGGPKAVNQTLVAEKMGISQSKLSLIVNDRSNGNPETLSGEQVDIMLAEFGFDTEERKEIGIKFGLRLPRHYLEPMMGAKATTKGPKARYYGDIGAGLRNAMYNIEVLEEVPIPGWIAARYGEENIFVCTVIGDSMACDSVRDDIQPGTWCYFHAHIKPEIGDVVGVWLEKHELGVLKIYRPQPDFVVLQSYNHQYRPIIVDNENPGVIQGVLVGISGGYGRFRNGR
jgi:plasmid maintenance system antidote protein VapI